MPEALARCGLFLGRRRVDIQALPVPFLCALSYTFFLRRWLTRHLFYQLTWTNYLINGQCRVELAVSRLLVITRLCLVFEDNDLLALVLAQRGGGYPDAVTTPLSWRSKASRTLKTSSR